MRIHYYDEALDKIVHIEVPDRALVESPNGEMLVLENGYRVAPVPVMLGAWLIDAPKPVWKVRREIPGPVV